MNRRKAIFAMLAGIGGRFSYSQDTLTQSVSIDLKQITKFTFQYGSEKVEFSGKEIWQELNKCAEGTACFTVGKS
jgi:hypothetical protein